MSVAWTRAALTAIAVCLSLAVVTADEVPAPVIAAFQRYVDATESRMTRDRAGQRLLWLDQLPDARRTGMERRLLRGDVVSGSLREVQDASIAVRDAVFLHSIATVFLRGATLTDTVGLLQDFDHHAEIFAPMIRRSRIVGRHDDTVVVAGQFSHRKVVTIVYNAEIEGRCVVLNERQAECRSQSMRGAMVADAGRPTEREKPFRGDPRKQWFLRTYYRVEQRNGGTYVEHETLFVCPQLAPLTRVFTPLVREVPAEVSRAMLVELRRRLSRN